MIQLRDLLYTALSRFVLLFESWKFVEQYTLAHRYGLEEGGLDGGNAVPRDSDHGTVGQSYDREDTKSDAQDDR